MTATGGSLDDDAPIVVGVGQVTVRDAQWPDVVSPLSLMADAARAAFADSGAAAIAGAVDAVVTVKPVSWDHGDTPSLLADDLGLGDGARVRLPIGGNTPQAAVNLWAQRLAAGDCDVVLLAGAEAGRSKRAAKKAGQLVDWPVRAPSADDPDAPERTPSHPVEVLHHAIPPSIVYPLFEPALRVAAGRTPEDHAVHLGELFAPFSDVAAADPYAWFPVARTAAEITTPAPDNRMIAEPYTKYMNAVLQVDMGAAVLLTTVGTARRLGVPSDRWVWLRGGAEAADVWYVSERLAYDRSPAMQAAHNAALAGAGVGLDDVAHFDLYSCFPSAVQLAQRALGLADDDPRALTVTGGLPYFGGPGNNYVTHSMAAMVAKLRDDPGAVGLVTGNGWFATKHSAGVYASAPPPTPYRRADPDALQARCDADAHPVLVETIDGDAVIDGYTVTHGRDGAPELALAIVRAAAADADGPERRTMALTRDRDLIDALRVGEWFGRTVTVRRTPDGTNTFDPH